jgi:hypothetical protein
LIINSTLLVVVGFFIKYWISSVEKRLSAKIDGKACEQQMDYHCKDIDNLKYHFHTQEGNVYYRRAVER